MFRYAIPLATAVLTSFAPYAAFAQQSFPAHPPYAPAPYAARPVGVTWSMPLTHVTRHVPSWSVTDVGLASGFLAVLWVDAAQTRSLANNNWAGFYEVNPIIGPRPTVGQINSYTAAAAVTTLGVAALLPARARRWWLLSALAIETYAVTATTRSGIALRLN
jgi:hypothetical protein